MLMFARQGMGINSQGGGGGGNEEVDGNAMDWPDGPTDAAPTRKASVASASGQKGAAGGPSRKASVA